MKKTKCATQNIEEANYLTKAQTKELGEELRCGREGRYGYSLRRFAEITGISVSTIVNFEKGISCPKLDIVNYLFSFIEVKLRIEADYLDDFYPHYKQEGLAQLDTILSELNPAGVKIIKEFIEFISSKAEYRSETNYQKKKAMAEKHLKE